MQHRLVTEQRRRPLVQCQVDRDRLVLRVVKGAKAGHQSAGGSRRWCPELESRPHRLVHPRRLVLVHPAPAASTVQRLLAVSAAAGTVRPVRHTAAAAAAAKRTRDSLLVC